MDSFFQACDPDDPKNELNVAFYELARKRQKIRSIFQACDSHEAISLCVTSLEGLNKLIAARHEAGYKLGMHLDEWIILGRFMLDSCGNFMKINGGEFHGIIPAEKYPDFPKVMIQIGLWSYIESRKENPDEHISISSSPSWLPEADQICPVCKKGWTVDNCHDFVDSHDDQVIDAKDFVGQTVADFKAKWNRDNHQVYWFLRGETNLRNKKYIDHSIRQDDDWYREHKVQVNERGWVATTDDHVIEKGDFLYVHLVTYRHEKCYHQRQAKLENAYFKRIFQSAGYQNIRMTRIPNQYDGDNCLACAPWYNVFADEILFTIGWRKRVIEIKTTDPRINFTKLFPKEDVTKSTTYIHAWGRQKCVAYLCTVKDIVSKQ